MITLPFGLDFIIIKATNDMEFRDILRRKFYTRELLKQAEEKLGECYGQLTTAKGVELENLTLHRRNIETHIEFLNRECERACSEVDEWIPKTNVETRKTLNQLELDYNNNVFD